MVDQLYWKPMLRTRNKLGDSVMAPLLVLVFILFYALSTPSNYSETGFLFFYPLYTDYTIQCFYTTGTWIWLMAVTWLMQAFANKQFNATAYKLLSGSSLFAYLSHYFFIILVAVFIIRPYKITFIPALLITLLLVNAVILATYWILNFLWELAFPPKKKEASADSDDVEQMGLLKNQEITVEAKAK
jgi:hypothetical protein